VTAGAEQAGANQEPNRIRPWGFRLGRGGAHTARSLMLPEFETLIDHIGGPQVPQDAYRRAIEGDNCLGKRSFRARALTYKHLVELYSLDPSVPLFQALLFFWLRDAEGRPLLALLSAYARDGVLRAAAPFVLGQPEGAAISRQELEAYLDTRYPARFSAATLKSTAQNINTTMTRAGWLAGRKHKVRVRPAVTAGATAYALLLGYLRGVRGELLLETEYAKLLGGPPKQLIGLAEEAGRRGWIAFRRIDRVIDVQFPRLLADSEREEGF